MQTFLPYPNFMMSVGCLDWRRLGNQRVECKQIWLAVTNIDYGWQNHPAVRMWRGYQESLALYGWLCCVEWQNRGYGDNLAGWFVERAKYNAKRPIWLGSVDLHTSHQSNLIRKDPKWYRRFWPDVDPTQPYYWPR